MSLKKKYLNDDEVDLVDVFITVWKYKWKISLFILIPVLVIFLYIINQPSNKLSYIATTKINPISTFEEFEYENYNSYLKNTDYENVFYSFNPFKEDLEKSINQKAFVFKDIDFYNNTDNSSFKKIDKDYLLNLFIDKLNENTVFINAIKKFRLIKREDYKSNQDYENAVMKLSYSIKLNSMIDQTKIDNKKNVDGNLLSFNIEFITEDKKTWEKILIFIQENTNNEVKKYLNESFDRLILNQVRLRKYKVEDIDILISGAKNNNKKMYVDHLETLKNDILQNRNIERLQNEFKSTPIMKSEDFYAAKLIF